MYFFFFFQLDMNLALEKVYYLKGVIARSCRIPHEKQVLLISGGESLDSEERCVILKSIIQPNLGIRNFLIIEKLFSNAMCSLSLSGGFDQSTIQGINSKFGTGSPKHVLFQMEIIPNIENQEKRVSFLQLKLVPKGFHEIQGS